MRTYLERAHTNLVAKWLSQPHLCCRSDCRLLSPGLMAWNNLLTDHHIADTYLLALAVKNQSVFVTLDQGISLAAVQGVQIKHLVVLGT